MSHHKINLKCQYCGKEIQINVTQEQIDKYQSGELIQRAFPNLTAEQREMLLTGTCGECWDKIFPHDGDADEDPTLPFNQ